MSNQSFDLNRSITKKQIVAIREEKLRADKPVMVCPDVQPFAYRVPKPTQNPPKTIIRKPFSEKIEWRLKISEGTNPLRLESPILFRSAIVFSLS